MLKIHEINNLDKWDKVKVRDNLGNDFYGLVVKVDKVSQWVEVMCYQHKEYDIRRRVFWYGATDRLVKISKLSNLLKKEEEIFSKLGEVYTQIEDEWKLYHNNEITYSQLEDKESQVKELELYQSLQLKELYYNDINKTRKVFDILYEKLYYTLGKGYNIVKHNVYSFSLLKEKEEDEIKLTYDIRKGNIVLVFNTKGTKPNFNKEELVNKLTIKQGKDINNKDWFELKVGNEEGIEDIEYIVNSLKQSIEESINNKNTDKGYNKGKEGKEAV